MDIANLINAVVLGIVEGLTEFLPVSSTGHLVLVNQFFSFADQKFTNVFNYLVQTGAILAVVLYFRRRVIPFYPGLSPAERQASWLLWGKVLVGFLPFVILGVLFIDSIETWLMSPWTVALALVVWGVGILVVEHLAARNKLVARHESIGDFGWGLVLAIGLIQCLALVPGTSRSAATIMGALVLGTSRVAAAEFSFFISIPTLLGAGVYGLYKELKAGMVLGSSEVLILVTGMVTAFAVALLVVRFFMKYISRHDFKPFAWYRIVLGLLILGLMAGGWSPA